MEWTIKAYHWKDGSNHMVQWASGLSHSHAAKMFKQLHDRKEFAMITMKENK